MDSIKGMFMRDLFVNKDNGDDARKNKEIEKKLALGDGVRLLGNNYNSYLVDRKGESYEPYSLAWRYLGMFIDCDNRDDEEEGEVDEERNLEEGGGCSRQILWAAYHDPRYRGGEIGEYQYYDLSKGKWDESTCQTRRCAKMNCHEPSTHFKLVGVFKEMDGLEDWAEQLFKHHGYCAWDDEDTYDFMDGERENWPAECKQLTYTFTNEDGSDGDPLYYDTKPISYGDITHGVYTDEYCTVESKYDIFDYIRLYFKMYYGDESFGESTEEGYAYAIKTWNENMETYKICQPCRAYTKEREYNDDDDDGEDENERFLRKLSTGRLLDNDGNGDDERWGYNCYDDAGYTNCNQCYKFETKTDMEVASRRDLAKASKQGTILKIVVGGRVYGKGGIGNQIVGFNTARNCLIIAAIAGAGLYTTWFWLKKKKFRRRRRTPLSFEEELNKEDKDANDAWFRSGHPALLTAANMYWRKGTPSPLSTEEVGGNATGTSALDDVPETKKDSKKKAGEARSDITEKSKEALKVSEYSSVQPASSTAVVDASLVDSFKSVTDYVQME